MTDSGVENADQTGGPSASGVGAILRLLFAGRTGLDDSGVEKHDQKGGPSASGVGVPRFRFTGSARFTGDGVDSPGEDAIVVTDCGDPLSPGENAMAVTDGGDPHSLSLSSDPDALPDGRVSGDSGSIADAKLAKGQDTTAGHYTAPARSKLPHGLESADARRWECNRSEIRKYRWHVILAACLHCSHTSNDRH